MKTKATTKPPAMTTAIHAAALFFLLCGPAGGASLNHYLRGDLHRNLFPTSDEATDAPVLLAESHVRESRDVSDSGISMDDYHKYLGYAALGTALAAGVSGSDNGFHKSAGAATAVLAVAACATGFWEYSNYFDVNEGLSKHNIHIVLGTLAAVGFVAAAADAFANDDKGHAGVGIASGVVMVLPVAVLHF